MKTRLSRATALSAAALAAALSLGLPAAPAAAQAVMVADGQGSVQPGDAAALIARADSLGRVMVIVGVDAGFVPEGTLDAAAVADQRAGIAAAQARVLEGLAAPEAVTRFETVPYVAMALDAADLARLFETPGLTSITEDVPVPPLLSESIPLINADRAWRAGFDGTGRAVAVLDTGALTNHRAFGGAIVSEACYSQTIAGQSVSNCPNGNNVQIGRGAGQDCDPRRVFGCGHGTHVSGTAMGDMPGARGVAKGANLVSINVFSRFDSATFCGSRAPCVLSYNTDQVRGLERVLFLHNNGIVRGIDSANMSLGGGQFLNYCDTQNPALTAVIRNLRSAGIATAIASGNNGFDGSMSSPACISAAVAVGSTTKADAVSSFSNHAFMVDLMAPGSLIEAPYVTGRRNGLAVLSGTSMATPHVAGAWAVVRQAHPRASVSEVQRALACTGEAVGRNLLLRTRINVNAARRFLDDPLNRRTWGFGNAAQVNQWTQHTGNWVHSNNRMRVLGNQAQRWYVASSPLCAENVRVDARLRRVDPDTATAWNSGLLLASSIDAQKNANGIWFYYNKAGGGVAGVFALQNNLLTGASVSRQLCRNDSAAVRSAINVGGINNLRVVSQDGLHRFLINGTLVCEVRDSTFRIGHVSVAMAAPGRDRAHVFDVLRVEARTLASAMRLAGAGEDEMASTPGGWISAPEGGALELRPGETIMGVSID